MGFCRAGLEAKEKRRTVDSLIFGMLGLLVTGGAADDEREELALVEREAARERPPKRVTREGGADGILLVWVDGEDEFNCMAEGWELISCAEVGQDTSAADDPNLVRSTPLTSLSLLSPAATPTTEEETEETGAEETGGKPASFLIMLLPPLSDNDILGTLRTEGGWSTTDADDSGISVRVC